ncbi:MAG: ABC transporter ATP-binding protein, partial [Myxococcota bacterium]
FLYFARTLPGQTLGVVAALLFSGLLSGLGIAALFPVLQIVIEGGTADPAGAGGFAGRVVDGPDALRIPAELEPLLAVTMAIFLTKAIVLLVAKRQVGYAVTEVATGLRLRLLRALLRTRWSYYTRLPIGQATNALTSEADRAGLTYNLVAQVVQYAIMVAIGLGLAFAVSWRATLMVGTASIFLTVLLRFLVRMAGRAGRRQTRLLRSLAAGLTDVLGAAKLLRATAREALVGDLLEHDTRRLNKALRKQVLAREALGVSHEPLAMAVILLGIWGAVRVVNMPAAEITILGFLFIRSLGDISRVQRKYQSMTVNESALWSILELIDGAEAQEEPAGGTRVPTLERGLSLRGVTVEYDGQNVLDGVDVEVPAGSITAMIGPSGSGKTTIADLFVGIASPQGGSVEVDGVALPELDLKAWRRGIGYVAQELLLLNDTVRTNVTLGDANISDEAVERALRAADAWEVVSRLPGGLDAPVGERGALLSGGQRQRIQIARALVLEPRLLVMDEATASLDSETEASVLATISQLRGRTTVVAISHQPALVDVADRVYRIEEGHAQLTKGGAAELPSVEGVA